jgi:hypothetical protein
VYFSRCIIGMALFVAACGARAAPPPAQAPSLHGGPAAHPIAWASRDRTMPIVAPTVHHLQMLITRGWRSGEHYVWLVSRGSDLISVYRATQSELGEVLDEVTHRYYPTVGNPTDQASYIILGSFKPPPPPPPDPGGIPDEIVRQVMSAAAAMERESAHFDGRPAGQAIGGTAI